MNKILVFGSLNIDIVYELDHIAKPGETIQSLSIERNAGGKGLNQAIAIAKTGLDVYMAGKIGKDGEFLKDVLSSSHVDTSFVSVSSNASSGNAIIERSRDGQNAIILFAGTNKEIDEDDIEKVLSAFGTGDTIVLQNEINALDSIIRKAKERGMYIVFNPAPFDIDVLSLPLEDVDLIVVNEIEGVGLAGVREDTPYQEILYKIMGKYQRNEVILTCGEAGAYYGRDNEIIHVNAIRTKAIDTTAAGDTFIGYFIASRILGYDIASALSYAAKASSIAVSRRGAAESVPFGEEVFNKR